MGSSTAGSCERTVQGHIHMADRQVRRHADPLNALPAEAKARLRKRPQPEWAAPMLATLTQERFSREGWLFEPKWDGERCIAVRRGRKLSLFSRNRILLNVKYPEIVTALDQQETGSFIADGEIVTFKDGITSFAKLQERMQVAHPSPDLIRQIPVWLYLFDVVYFECYDNAAARAGHGGCPQGALRTGRDAAPCYWRPFPGQGAARTCPRHKAQAREAPREAAQHPLGAGEKGRRH
jgi:hypothetical protein